jgi:hypothetical protein
MGLMKKPEFTIHVTHDLKDDLWIAECDDIHLVTEAPSYDALVQRALLIADELAVINGKLADGQHASYAFRQLIEA